ncbi:Glyoxylate/hydroxypyruvate reductase B [bioreactor metagenome]|uniref:Glyoxylate/hydroxypyruvate reductase B n=1 Tax=bioreactor metagenome TaxID=1076179 RepID=A0A645ECZ8_9ZZZZ
MLKESDIVSLHLPNTPQTKGFLDKDKLALMKEGALFINCARGPIVDTKALSEVLNSGKISAALDVFDTEPPLASDYPLVTAKQTLLTPHVAFLTKEAMVRRSVTEFGNVLSYLNGEVKNRCTF